MNKSYHIATHVTQMTSVSMNLGQTLTMVSEVGFFLVFFVNPEGQICNGMSCLVCLKTSYLLDGWHGLKMDPNGHT